MRSHNLSFAYFFVTDCYISGFPFRDGQVVALGGQVCDSGTDVASSVNKADQLTQSAQKKSKAPSKTSQLADTANDGNSGNGEEEEDRTGIVACTHVIAIDLKRSETMFLAILLGKPVCNYVSSLCGHCRYA